MSLTPTRFLKSGVRRGIHIGKRSVAQLARITGVHHAKRGLALALRRTVPCAEKVVPPLGRRMRNWGWIWQPTFSHGWLNNFYDKTVDPYHFDGVPYEAEKYAHTMRLLNGRTYASALEIGAAEGVFTEILAPICDSLLAIEVAEAAVARGKERLAGQDNVTFVQAALPNEMPPGPFDLMVASDVLYYFPQDVLLELLQRFEQELRPGGVFFALHYLGDFGQPVIGRRVHDLMKQHLSLELTHEETVADVGPGGEGYTISTFKK